MASWNFTSLSGGHLSGGHLSGGHLPDNVDGTINGETLLTDVASPLEGGNDETIFGAEGQGDGFAEYENDDFQGVNLHGPIDVASIYEPLYRQQEQSLGWGDFDETWDNVSSPPQDTGCWGGCGQCSRCRDLWGDLDEQLVDMSRSRRPSLGSSVSLISEGCGSTRGMGIVPGADESSHGAFQSPPNHDHQPTEAELDSLWRARMRPDGAETTPNDTSVIDGDEWDHLSHDSGSDSEVVVYTPSHGSWTEIQHASVAQGAKETKKTEEAEEKSIQEKEGWEVELETREQEDARDRAFQEQMEKEHQRWTAKLKVQEQEKEAHERAAQEKKEEELREKAKREYAENRREDELIERFVAASLNRLPRRSYYDLGHDQTEAIEDKKVPAAELGDLLTGSTGDQIPRILLKLHLRELEAGISSTKPAKNATKEVKLTKKERKRLQKQEKRQNIDKGLSVLQEHCGTDPHRLVGWQRLCILIDTHFEETPPESITKCKKMIKAKRLNIVNVLEHLGNNEVELIKFKSHRSFVAYTNKHAHKFPLKKAKENRFLRELLRHL